MRLTAKAKERIPYLSMCICKSFTEQGYPIIELPKNMEDFYRFPTYIPFTIDFNGGDCIVLENEYVLVEYVFLNK